MFSIFSAKVIVAKFGYFPGNMYCPFRSVCNLHTSCHGKEQIVATAYCYHRLVPAPGEGGHVVVVVVVSSLMPGAVTR